MAAAERPFKAARKYRAKQFLARGLLEKDFQKNPLDNSSLDCKMTI